MIDMLSTPLTTVSNTQNAVTRARQYLQQMETSLFGAFVSAPRGSKLAMLIVELQDVETELATMVTENAKAMARR